MGGGFDERVFTGLKAWGAHLLVAHSRPLGYLREGMGLGRDDSDSSGHKRPGLWEGRDCPRARVRSRDLRGQDPGRGRKTSVSNHIRLNAFDPQGFDSVSSSHCVLAQWSHSWGSMMSHVPGRKQVCMS